MSLLLRLTIFYVTLLAVMLAAFGSFVYVLFELNMLQEIDAALEDRASDTIRLMTQSTAAPISPRLPAINAFTSGDFYLQLLNTDGDVLDRSSNLGRLRIPARQDWLDKIRATGADWETISTDRATLRVFTIPIRVNGDVLLYMQVARSLDELEVTMRRLRQVLIFGSVGTTVVAFILGSLIAGRAIRPIDRITQTARRIGVSGNLHERVKSRGPRDEIGRLAGTFNDMLDRLEKAYDQLHTALTAQRRFVADASHELRTPLTTVRGNIDFLMRHPDLPESERLEALSDAGSEARRMSRLVEDLLFLARADAGQRLQKVPVEVADIVRDVVRQAKRLAGDRLEIVEGPSVEATVLASADHFKQLLLILVDNASKYTAAGGTVTISTFGVGDPPAYGIEVRDTGQGISPEALPHVFDRFYRADNAREGEGAGLGLAIAGWLVEEHGGRVEVQSELGKGSVFTVWLPALEVRQRREGTPAEFADTKLVA